MDTIESTQQQARELLNSRIASVTDLVKARQLVTELEAKLVEAKKEDKKAYVRATKDGWSADELKKLGLDQGATVRRKTAAKKTTDNQSAPASEA
ncbi:hypothetical protein DQ353_19190 [Arthrobacter sp. AQ5-05]|uniref:hypothetical protein n=1 Tax=Arthrobacter sp. AQ5-05 TaxID=2184581 RepID=UPI000DCC4447|nr:hypothetical protein [Arthrobacter sp. AQ5-05]RAX47304.1 hypothetical protein DQ353_19190 [Arthrobacter sp. AQ5-05]